MESWELLQSYTVYNPVCGSGSASFCNLDPNPEPHPHQIKIQIRIRIKEISWICISLQITSQNVRNMILFERTFSRVRAIIWKLRLDPNPHQGEKSDPDSRSHQIKIQIRIRIRIRTRASRIQIHNTYIISIFPLTIHLQLLKFSLWKARITLCSQHSQKFYPVSRNPVSLKKFPTYL